MGAEARRSLYEYCRLNQKQYLLDEWDDGRNLPLTPQTITYGSKRPPGGAAQTATPGGRCSTQEPAGARCPYCTGRRVQPGFNDLASVHPELARQWGLREKRAARPGGYQRRKREIRLVAVRKGAQLAGAHPVPHGGLRLPGLCRKTAPARRKRPRVGSVRSLAKQWDAARNGNQRPQDVLPGTEKKVWWIATRPPLRAAISMRTRSLSSCPVCAGKQVLPGFNDLASQKPALAAQWDAARNGTLTPEQVTPASNRKAWWRCEKGHSFQAVIASRANGQRLPILHEQKKCWQASTILQQPSRKSPPNGTRRATAL